MGSTNSKRPIVGNNFLTFRKGQCFKSPWKRAFFVKADIGFILMEDVTFPGRDSAFGGKLHVVDKTKIISPEIGKAAMKSLAHFHGIWLTWLTKVEPKTVGGMTKDQFYDIFAMVGKLRDMKDMLKINKYGLIALYPCCI